MGTITGRYDASASAYDTWWAPVLRSSALRLLHDLDVPDGTALDILDVGAGSGALAFEMVRRWPSARIALVDGSEGMLGVAERGSKRLARALRERLSFTTALADQLPFADSSFDAVVSSFVMQLVPNRARALAEARRVLRPGGRIAFVTWLAGKDEGFAPDDAFYDALDDCGIPDELEPEEARSGDLASVEAAAAQLRRAGFRDVDARGEWLIHRFDPATYPEFLEQYAERDTFAGLDDNQLVRVRARTRERLAELSPEAFVWRAPIVYARGNRTAERTRSPAEP